jgi:hypothetical protein
MGDLYVRITVNFPPSIDPSVIPLLEQALPPRQKMVIPTGANGKKLMTDEVTLEEPNDRQRRAAQNGEDGDEDDDERGGPGVQCAQRAYYAFSYWIIRNKRKSHLVRERDVQKRRSSLQTAGIPRGRKS